MNKVYTLTISASKANRLAHVNKTIEITQGNATTHIVAKGGERFQLQEVATGFSPKKISMKRVGNDLHIQFELDTQSDVIIENYYNNTALPNELGGINEKNQIFDYLVSDAQENFAAVELGGQVTESIVGSGGMIEALGDMALPLGLAIAAGGAGAAFGMGGGGSKGSAKIATPAKAAEEDNLNEAADKPANKPNIFIQSPPKAMRTQLLVDGVLVESTLTQAVDGRYYLVPVLPLSEGEHSITYRFVNSSGHAGKVSPALDIVVPPQDVFVTLNTIVADGTLNAADVAEPLVISGKTNALVGTTVTITGLDNVTRTATVVKSAVNRSTNIFSLTIPAADVTNFSQGEHSVVVTITDRLNQTSRDTQTFNVNTQTPNAPPALSIPENADGRISAEEAQDGTLVNVSLGGTLAVAGDSVNVYINGVLTTYVLTQQDITSNNASVIISQSVLEAAGQGSAIVTATITNMAGNTSASSDSTTVILVGSNHAPSQHIIAFSGIDTGSIIEDATPSTIGGKLTIDNVDDTTEVGFQAAANLNGTYGVFTFDAAKGDWTYTLNNSNASVQALAASATVKDVLVVKSVDGTAHNIVVTITGTNDTPIIQVTPPTTHAIEGVPYNLTGIFRVSDVDVGNNVMTASLNPNADIRNGNLHVDVGQSGVDILSSFPNAKPGYVYLSGTLTQLNALLAGQDGASITLKIMDGAPPPKTTLRLYVDDNAKTNVSQSDAITTFTVDNVNNAPVLKDSDVVFVNTSVTDSSEVATTAQPSMEITQLTANITDQDANPKTGIAITGVHSGKLYYTLHNDEANPIWTALTQLSPTHAFLLDATAQHISLRFDPDSNAPSTIDNAISFRAWDQTTGLAGSYYNGDNATNDATSAFSSFEENVLVNTISAPIITKINGLAESNAVSYNVNTVIPTVEGKADPKSHVYVFQDDGLGNGFTLSGVVDVDKDGVWHYTAGNNSIPNFGVINSILANHASYTFKFIAKNDDGFSSESQKQIKIRVEDATLSPIVLDINQDGVLHYGQEIMDVNDDGQREQSAWAGKEDGVLIWDKYADARVHDSSQYAFSQYGGNTDLSGLAAGFDTNHDGVLTAQDAKFGDFAVWRDANQNGISDNGEVYKLSDLGITTIDLNTDNVVRHPAEGVVEYGRTTATLENGASMLVSDAVFTYQALKLDDLVAAPKSSAMPLFVESKTIEVSALPYYDVKANLLHDELLHYSLSLT